jgi:hypothetical protein
MVSATACKTAKRSKGFLSDATSETGIWSEQGLAGSALRCEMVHPKKSACLSHTLQIKQSCVNFLRYRAGSLWPHLGPQLMILAKPTGNGQ